MGNIFGGGTDEVYVSPPPVRGPNLKEVEELIIKHVCEATKTVAVRSGADWNSVTYLPREDAERLGITDGGA